MGKTFAEKILAKKSGLKEVVPGQIVTVKPEHLLTHDNTAAIIGKISADLDKYGVVDPNLSVIIIDHVVPASDEKIATNHKRIREFVKKFIDIIDPAKPYESDDLLFKQVKLAIQIRESL